MIGLRVVLTVLLIVYSLQDATHLQSILNPLSAARLWRFYGAAIPTKSDTKVTPDIPDKIGFLQTRNKIQSNSKWEVKTTINIGKEAGARGAIGEGLAFWVLLDEMKYEDRKYSPETATMYGGDGLYKGLGIFLLPKQNKVIAKESMGIVAYNPDSLKQDALSCPLKINQNSRIQMRIAFSDGITLVYFKTGLDEKFELCLTSTGVGKALKDFYFGISAVTKRDAYAFFSINDLMIFSDEMLEGDFSAYLNPKNQHEVHSRDILRAGHASNASEYGSSLNVPFTTLTKSYNKNAAFLLGLKNRLGLTLKDNEVSLRWIHSVKFNMPSDSDSKPLQGGIAEFGNAFDKMKGMMMMNSERYTNFRQTLEKIPLTGKIEGLIKKLEDFTKKIESIEYIVEKQGYHHVETRARMKSVVEEHTAKVRAPDEHILETKKLLKKKTSIVKAAWANRWTYFAIIALIIIIFALIIYAWRKLSTAEKAHLF
eukprot:TRINITY_DN10350_c0_g2_i4.p1 TRINITY_DN10350_c0_g2~~TRINITY_DN10350_c0_g2_i4.p1  ORF type:complete len:482 (+),score=89.45 TRINITY_DN10350_c0_g2_i4:63-1508(+)